jgi:hypothetical protein
MMRKTGRGRAYLLQRAVDERRAAARATCDEAKIAHRKLARCYLGEAREMRSDARHANATVENTAAICPTDPAASRH